MKVWLVTSTDHGDFVFSTQKAAKEFCRDHYDPEWPWDITLKEFVVSDYKKKAEKKYYENDNAYARFK